MRVRRGLADDPTQHCGRIPTMENNATSTLYYDGQCPLCRREMDRLRGIKSDALELTDIHGIEGLDQTQRHQLLKTLHLQSSDGNYLTGLEANVAAWQHTSYGWLFRWMLWPIIRPIADVAYRYWAEWRYRRLYESESDTR